MFKLIVLVAVLISSVWGNPQSFAQYAARNTGIDGRIVGGVDTTIENHPYIVSVLRSNSHICAGSILSSTWILSAAHCFTASASVFSVRAGSTVRNSGGQVVALRRYINHALYDPRTIDYDISVLELVSPITISVARAIALAAAGGPPAGGTISIITGWGAISEGGPSASILQVAQVPIVSIANCRAAYGQEAITDRMLCAGLLGIGGIDACQGDSGGPLVANGVLTGVVSWGWGCARPNSPGVYASVPNLRGWILQNSGI